MKKEKFEEIINNYGNEISERPEYKSINVDEKSYLRLTMRHIAFGCFEKEDIKDVNTKGFYSTLKSRISFMKILNSLNRFATLNKNELNDFINYLIDNEHNAENGYNAGNGFNIRFEQNRSNLEIILEKRKN